MNHIANINAMQQAGWLVVAWMPHEIDHLDKAQIKTMEAQVTQVGQDFIFETMPEDDSICPSCDGSGEGMHEGTRCFACRGKGQL